MSYRHGTYTAYARHGCRCDHCTTYQRTRVKKNRLDRLARDTGHGKRAMYDAGCRCDSCRATRLAAYQREKRNDYWSRRTG